MKKFRILKNQGYSTLIEYLISSKKEVFLLEGGLGAGKTTLVSQFCELLSLNDKNQNSRQVSSPTYSLINEYKVNDLVILHADFYRLNEKEAFEIEEVLELINAAHYSFVEWPSKLEGLEECLNDHLTLNFTKNLDDSREILIK